MSICICSEFETSKIFQKVHYSETPVPKCIYRKDRAFLFLSFEILYVRVCVIDLFCSEIPVLQEKHITY